MTTPEQAKILSAKIRDHTATIGGIGLGYVGLPLVICFGEENFNVIGFDIDDDKVKTLNRGESYIKHIKSERIARLLKKNKFKATLDYAILKKADCIIICVPTPLDDKKEPDLSFIENPSDQIASSLREGQLISLESTTYHGTTRELLLPKFENTNSSVNIALINELY